MYKHILIPTDGSERSLRAIRAGLELAKIFNARVTSLCVSEATYIAEVDHDNKPRVDAALAMVEEAAGELQVSCNCASLVSDTPQDAIVRYATDRGCDLIVMGTHGRSRVGKLFLGSTAAAVVADCEIPVLLYR